MNTFEYLALTVALENRSTLARSCRDPLRMTNARLRSRPRLPAFRMRTPAEASLFMKTVHLAKTSYFIT